MLQVIDSKINRFLLCKTVAKATRSMHRKGERVEVTIQNVIRICVQSALPSPGCPASNTSVSVSREGTSNET